MSRSELCVHISLCGHLFWWDRVACKDRYVPGQELVDTVDGVVCDAFKNVVELELRVETVEFG